MESFINKVFEKISSYSLINFLLPGFLFAIIGKICLGYNLFQEPVWFILLICYFTGLICSRIGSVLIEPILKKCKLINFDYTSFVKAELLDKEKKIDLLAAFENAYRTYSAVFLCSIIARFCFVLKESLCICRDKILVLLILLFILFIMSYIKQNDYVYKRSHILTNKNGD